MTETPAESDSGHSMAACASSAAWGFAEATMFFLVPDVLLTWLAVARPRLAIQCCAFAIVGALVGGTVMYFSGVIDAATARRVLDGVPAVSPGMIDAVGEAIEQQGIVALFFGPLTGTPYKVFAVQAGASGRSVLTFLLISIPARGLRFLGLTLLSAGIARGIGDRLTLAGKRRLVIAVWAAFYAWYFAVMPN